MENSAQKAGFAIAAMIAVIVAVGISVDLWDAHQLRKAENGSAPNDPAAEASVERRLTEEINLLKSENQLLNMRIDELKKQLQAAEKKELEPLKKDPEALKPEADKAEPSAQNDEPIADN